MKTYPRRLITEGSDTKNIIFASYGLLYLQVLRFLLKYKKKLVIYCVFLYFRYNGKIIEKGNRINNKIHVHISLPSAIG